MKRAKIIVIEGTDGSGKETQSKKIEEHYKNEGLKVKTYSFPEYSSPTGKIVGGSYLGKPEIGDSVFPETSANVDPLVSSLYYAADRRYNFLKYIEEELYKNDINRPIQNVIKISDDQKLIKQELEEYVLTKELKSHFNTFFSSYNKSINNNMLFFMGFIEL